MFVHSLYGIQVSLAECVSSFVGNTKEQVPVLLRDKQDLCIPLSCDWFDKFLFEHASNFNTLKCTDVWYSSVWVDSTDKASGVR